MEAWCTQLAGELTCESRRSSLAALGAAVAVAVAVAGCTSLPAELWRYYQILAVHFPCHTPNLVAPLFITSTLEVLFKVALSTVDG